MAREFSRAFYKSKEWEDTRKSILMRDNYLCVKCGNPAEEVHHKIHLRPDNIGDPSITMSPDNLISLCRDCHFAEHKGDHGKGRSTKENFPQYLFDENGNIIPRV